MMTEPDSPTPTGPYAAAAQTYWAAGWRGILPIPHGQKAPVPVGWTGRDGAWPSFADIHAWTEDHGGGNIALRLPPGVLGIDCDHYGNKPGGAVLADWESRLGPLPATWRTTSRDDGISGIRLYRIPEGLRWPGILGPGIETIRTEHRYAVTWPSLHPGGSTYRWITPDGATALTDVPNVDDLPDLPAAWVEHFTKGEHATDQPRADLDDTAAGEWLKQRGELLFPCRAMKRALDRSLADLLTGASRHDAALSGTNRIVWLAGEGHHGQHDALADLRDAFLKATSGDRATGDAEAEWDRMVTGAVRMAAAAHPRTDGDPCDDPFAGLINRKEQPWTSPPPDSGSSAQPSAGSEAIASAPDAASSTTATDAEAASTDADEHRTTWWPRPLTDVLDGTNIEPPPTHLHRVDGHALLYANKINGIIGPSESGKTWAALAACVQAVHDGHNVTILDFEDTDTSVTNRLLLLGLTDTQVREQVAYIGPDEALHAVAASDLHEHLDAWQPAIVVLDGFNAAMTLHNFDLMSNKDATSFFQLVLRHLKKNGATVVYVDHTPKDKNNESSGGIGAQAKRAMTDGTILRASIVKEFGKGQKGTVRLFVDKDRHGYVRGVSSPFKVGERTMHWAADMILNPAAGDSLDVQLVDPQAVAEGRTQWRPTGYMERVSRWLEDNPGAGRNEILAGVIGTREHVKKALQVLVAEGWINVGQEGQKKPHTVVTPYSEDAELAGKTPENQLGSTGVGPGSATPVDTPGSVGSAGGDVVPTTTAPGYTRNGTRKNATGVDPSSRVVERVIAGEAVRVNLTTGEVIA